MRQSTWGLTRHGTIVYGGEWARVPNGARIPCSVCHALHRVVWRSIKSNEVRCRVCLDGRRVIKLRYR
jgi:hypothetical protein